MVLPHPVPASRHCLMGLPIHAVTLAEAEVLVRDAVARRDRLFLTTPNVNFTVACRRDADFRLSVIDSDLVVADGMPLVWAARSLGLPIRERVAGAALFERLCEPVVGRPPIRVYFFGGPAGVAAAAAHAVGRAGGGLAAAGHAAPGFGSISAMSAPRWIDAINASGADLLVVALGAAKGQAWLQRNRERLDVPVITHLGAVVNFMAGTVQRAPRWMQRAGLEWAWRIREEPRLWRRYAGDAVALLDIAVRQLLPGWWARLRPPAAEAWRAATATCTAGRAGSLRVRLAGAWGEPNCARLRAVLDTAGSAPGDLSLDCTALTYVDAAVLGCLLDLLRRRRRGGAGLLMQPVPKRVRRLFARHGAAYLVDAEVLCTTPAGRRPADMPV